jgi:hypothetical protein
MLFIPVVEQLSSQFPGQEVGVGLFNFILLFLFLLYAHQELHCP